MTDKKSDNVANMAARAEKKTGTESLIDRLAPDFRDMVDHIEENPPTTQDHYGAYMALLTQLVGTLGTDSPIEVRAQFLALVLLAAGANRRGVVSAMTALGWT